MSDRTLPLSCPFDDCDWTSSLGGATPERTHTERLRDAEERAEHHYHREHAGEVRVRVTLELSEALGGRDPHDVADYYHDRLAERDDLRGFDVAYAVAEVTEQPSTHSEVSPDGDD